MNAAEKARLARQQMKNQNQKNASEILKALLVILSYAGVLVLTILCYIFEIRGYSTFTPGALVTMKVFFWVGLVTMIVGFVIAIKGLADEPYEFLEWLKILSNGLSAIAVLVLSCITLFSGRMGIKDYITSEVDGVVYVEKKEGLELVGALEGATDITIRKEFNGYFIDEVPSNAFADNARIQRVSFVGGDISIGKEAFIGCSNLEYVTFDDGNYSFHKNVFSKCNKLKEFNVGKAELTYVSENIDHYIFGGKTNAKVIIDGGAMYKFEDNLSTVVIKSSDSKIQSNVGYFVVNQNIVFEEGFTFTADNFYLYYENFLMGIDDAYYPLALNIYLPKSVTVIPAKVFGSHLNDYVKKITIHYAGTEAEWANVQIDSQYNGNLSVAEIKYSSTYQK